jgi:hypothetical protein
MVSPINSHETLILIHYTLASHTMTAFNLNDLQEVHRAMTLTWSVKPEWPSYVGDASYEEYGEWPQTWTSEIDPPPWLPHWGNFLAPGFPDIVNLDDDEVAYELHTSVFQVPEGDLTRIYNVPLEYENMWTIRLYIRELEDNDLDGTEDVAEEAAEDQEEQEVQDGPEEPVTPEWRPLSVVEGVPLESDSDSDDESEIGLTDGSDSEEEFEVSPEQAIGIVRQLFPEEPVVPQHVKDNCREGLRILEEIMGRETPVMKENDYVELCNIFRDVFQMKGSHEVVT